MHTLEDALRTAEVVATVSEKGVLAFRVLEAETSVPLPPKALSLYRFDLLEAHVMLDRLLLEEEPLSPYAPAKVSPWFWRVRSEIGSSSRGRELVVARVSSVLLGMWLSRRAQDQLVHEATEFLAFINNASSSFCEQFS